MRPFDALTEIDKKTIEAYFSIYGNTKCGPLPLVLRYWNKNKTTLFKALGGSLRVSKMIDVPKNNRARMNELEGIYHPYIINYDTDVIYVKSNFERIRRLTHNEFIADVLFYWVNKNYCIEDLSIITELFLHRNFDTGYIQTLIADRPYRCKDFNCTIKNGMKTLRTIQKVLKATRYPHMNLFQQWSNTVNRISCTEEFKSKLTISIHPIDFISMSDNNCNWRSCMSWANTGCYRSGTLEMMNSNIAVVAYLEAANPFTLSLDEDHKYNIPNKRWRSLFFIHKDILLSGKSYPNHNTTLDIMVLDFLRELVKKNLNWDYQFINQEYQDMKHLEGNFYVRDIWYPGYNVYHQNSHKILVYTNAMYNDIIESKYPKYWCCRNKVKKTIKICLSGPATCICCGNKILEPTEIIDYDSIGTQLICDKCIENKTCYTCGRTNYHNKYQGFKLSTYYTKLTFCDDQCAREQIFFPKFHRIAPKLDLIKGMSDHEYYFLISENMSDVKAQELLDSFWENPSITEKWMFEGYKIVKIPSRLAGYGYVYISYSSYSYKINSKNGTDHLYILDTKKDAKTIEKLEWTKERIPLDQILKGSGSIESSITMTY